MSVQRKKRQRSYDLLNAETKPEMISKIISIRKHANEFKVYGRTIWIAIKQDWIMNSFARTHQHIFESKDEKKKRMFTRGKKQKQKKKSSGNFFLYFSLQIYGLHQAQTLTPLITLNGGL